MKRHPKLLLRLIIVAFAVFFLVRWLRAPSEAEMLSDFYQNRAVLEQLVLMARADHLEYLSSDFDSTQSNGTAISRARFDAYQKLLQTTRLSHIILYHSRPSVYTFPVFGGGATDTSWAVGYAWSDKPLTSIVRSAYKAAPPRSMVYSKIEGNWFVYRR